MGEKREKEKEKESGAEENPLTADEKLQEMKKQILKRNRAESLQKDAAGEETSTDFQESKRIKASGTTGLFGGAKIPITEKAKGTKKRKKKSGMEDEIAGSREGEDETIEIASDDEPEKRENGEENEGGISKGLNPLAPPFSSSRLFG